MIFATANSHAQQAFAGIVDTLPGSYSIEATPVNDVLWIFVLLST